MRAKPIVRSLTGSVVSNKMDKTITVCVQRYVKHPIYEKVVLRSRSYHVHDEQNICQEGDVVEIVPCRPLSKKKAWIFSRHVTR